MHRVNAFERISCKFISPALFALGLYAAGIHADDTGTSIFSFNGFGTLGVAHSSEGQADFVTNGIKPKGAGYTHAWSLAVDSLIAGQITASLTPKLSAVVQGIAEQNYDNSYKPHMEWANIKYQFVPDFGVRIGRTVLPVFLVSDYRKVGYVNPWVRPPVELYSLVPISTSDGVDISYHLRIGEFSNNLQALYGNSKAKIPDEAGGGTVKANDLWGVTYGGEYRAATVHIAYLRTNNLTLTSVEPLFDGLRQFGPEGNAIANKYDPNHKPLTFIGIGGTYNPGAWFLTGEWGTTRSNSMLGKRSAWYVSGGHRVGKFTPYLTYAKAMANDISDPGLTVSAYPPSLAGAAASLNTGLDTALAPLPVQKTISAGVRWDFMNDICLKLQFDHTNIGSDSDGTLVNIQPGFKPGGSFNVFSATIDFVF
jgi:hypothetical protein